jgi:hypothetical protein
MVGHQTIRVTLDLISLEGGLENGQESASIVVVAVDDHLGVSTRDDMIESACGKKAKRPGHAGSESTSVPAGGASSSWKFSRVDGVP